MNIATHQDKLKSCVVLDLDSTLIHTFGSQSQWSFVESHDSSRIKNRIFDVKVSDQLMWGSLRPYTKLFISTCFETFDLVGIWSAGTSEYVREIIREVFDQQPHFIWTRKDCQLFFDQENGHKILQKPLTKLFEKYQQLDPLRTMIIDDYTDVCRQDTLYHVHIPVWGGKFESLTSIDRSLKQLSSWMKTSLKDQTDFKFVSHKDIFK